MAEQAMKKEDGRTSHEDLNGELHVKTQAHEAWNHLLECLEGGVVWIYKKSLDLSTKSIGSY